MKSTRQPEHKGLPYPQPLFIPGLQRREEDVEEEELEHARDWLRHLEAGRIGGGK